MYILRTVLFAFLVSFIATDTSAQVAMQSGDSPSQISAAPTTETTAQFYLRCRMLLATRLRFPPEIQCD